jgi:hypothetical protein
MANEFYYTAPTHIDVNVKTPTCIHLFARDAPITNPASLPPLGSLPLFRYTKDEIGQGVGSCPLREDSLQLLFTESPPSSNGAQSESTVSSVSFLIPASSLLRSPFYFNSSLLLCLCRILYNVID